MIERKRRNKKQKKINSAVEQNIYSILLFFSWSFVLLGRFFLTNRIGDTGNAYFSTALDIFLLFYALFGLFLKNVEKEAFASRMEREQYKNAQKVLKGGLVFCLAVGILFLVLCWSAGPVLCEKLFRTSFAGLLLKPLAPALFCLMAVAVLRGCFEALNLNRIAGWSYVIQCFTFFFVMIIFSKKGMENGQKVGELLRNTEYAQAYGAAGGAWGILAGSVLALLFLTFFALIRRGQFFRESVREYSKNEESYSKIMKELITDMLPLCLGTFLYQLFFLVWEGFYMHSPGTEYDINALTNWGIYTGKCRIITFLPFALIAYCVISVSPQLENYFEIRSVGKIREYCRRILRQVLLLAVPLCVLLNILAGYLLQGIFSTENSRADSNVLRFCAVIAFILVIDLVFALILGGMKKYYHAVACVIPAGAVGTLVAFMLKHLQFKTVYVAIWAELIFCVLFLISLLLMTSRFIHLKLDWLRLLLAPLVASLGMGIVAFLLSMLLSKVAGSIVVLLITLPVSAIVYLVTLLLLGAVRERELYRLPFGEQLVALAHKTGILRQKN